MPVCRAAGSPFETKRPIRPAIVYETDSLPIFRTIRLGFKAKGVPFTKNHPVLELGCTKMEPIPGRWSILWALVFFSRGTKTQ